MNHPHPPALSYSPRRPHRRRWFTVSVIVFGILVGVAIAYRRAPAIGVSLHQWNLEHQCATCTLGVGSVVYAEGISADAMPGQDEWGTPGRVFRATIKTPIPQAFIDLLNLIVNPQTHQTNFIFGNPNDPDAYLFLHKLRSRTGITRIFLIGIEPPFVAGDDPDIVSQAMTPGSTPAQSRYPSASGLGRLDSSRIRSELRLYAGEPIPGDPSAFRIKYEIDGRIGELTGRLMDDGDTIELRDSAPANQSVFISASP